jgi:transcription antitermination factor NusG
MINFLICTSCACLGTNTAIFLLCSKRQIKKPKPIPVEEVESIIREEKEEQEKVEKEFEEMENMGKVESFSKPVEESEVMLMNKIKKQFKKSPSKGGTSQRAFSPGSTVHVLSGPFEDFTGSILEVNRKNKKVGMVRCS